MSNGTKIYNAVPINARLPRREHNYPANWDDIRRNILQRDNHRCQVAGCPSLLRLHVHHKVALQKGGSNEPNNLITLCEFHHALEPEIGHRKIREEINNDRFIFVRGFYRRKPYYLGWQYVHPSLRRWKLISINDIEKLIRTFDFYCPNCNRQSIQASLYYERKQIILKCLKCFAGWIGTLQIAEETGPRIAELLTIRNDITSWRTNWSALNATGRFWKVYNFCPKCGATMHLVRPRENDRWPAFWGCDRFSETHCRGTREINK